MTVFRRIIINLKINHGGAGRRLGGRGAGGAAQSVHGNYTFS